MPPATKAKPTAAEIEAIVEELQSLRPEIETLEHARDEKYARRRDLIIRLVKAGMTTRQIAVIAGVTHMRVAQIAPQHPKKRKKQKGGKTQPPDPVVVP